MDRRHPSNIFRTSSMQSLNPRGSVASNQPYHGSAMDMSSMGIAYPRDFRGPAESLASSTPLALRFSEASNMTAIGNGDCQSDSYNPRQGRPTTSVGGASSASDYRTSTSLFPPTAPLTSDPRQLTSSKYQKDAMTSLYEFLVANGFDWKQPKTQFDLRALLPPSQSTLEKVFEFLMRKLLGEYKMEPGMKLETEVPHLANLLGYPYASSLKTNVLRAPNIASAVPVICGLLDWLREEVQVWLAMASNSDNGEDCGMATLFFRPDDGTEWNIDSVFHNARMEFMIDAYRSNQLSEDPDGDVSKLIEKFDGRMNECVGDVALRAETLREELTQRTKALQQRTADYESLDMINAKVAEKDRSNAAKKREMEELKFKMTRAEEDILNNDKEEKTIQAENEALRRQIALMEGKIKKQPMKKDDFLAMLKADEAQRNAVNQTEHEIAGVKGRIEALMREKAKYTRKLHDIVQELREGLVEMDSTIRLEDLPYYNDEADVEEYIAHIKGEVDRVIEGVRSRCEKALQEIESSDTEKNRLSIKQTELALADKKLSEQEHAVRLKLAEMEKQKFAFDIPKLEETKRQLTANLEAGQASLKAIQEGNVVLERQLLKKKRGKSAIQQYIAKAMVEDRKFAEKFHRKQEERMGHLDKIADNLDDQLEKTKQAKSKLVNGMLAALTGRKEGMSNDAA